VADNDKSPSGAIGTRWVELAVALGFIVLGAIVVIDSHRVGIEWASDGPKAGYFPNFIGWILCVAGAWIAGETLYGWKKLASKVFVTREELKPVLLMLVPTIVYVGVIALVGIYVASALYIGAFMRVQGKYGWIPTLAVSIGVPVAIFLLFEIWFLVPLPKGPVEHLFGY
jgi:putative tricarboxylic transport membrane protein